MGTKVVIRTTALDPTVIYEVVGGPSAEGPFAVVLPAVTVPVHRLTTIEIDPATEAHYVLRAVP